MLLGAAALSPLSVGYMKGWKDKIPEGYNLQQSSFLPLALLNQVRDNLMGIVLCLILEHYDRYSSPQLKLDVFDGPTTDVPDHIKELLPIIRAA
ncbi:MAG: hypothetical protein O2779_01555 [Nanoarchaeota archaeon]|nr:hypothetical protein [Nanoarchaeota archaeon]